MRIQKTSTSLRKAEVIDIEFLWYLRNQPDVYQYARVSGPVLWEEHVGWISPLLLGLKDRELFVIQEDSLPVGQVRLDYEDDREKAEISISLLKEFRGKGIASAVLDMVIQDLSQRRKGITLIAEIHRNNAGSIALFEKFHFSKEGEREDFLRYKLVLLLE